MRRKSATIQDLGEPPVVPQEIPFRIVRKKNCMDVVRLDDTLEPLQGEIRFTKASVDQGESIRWNVSLTRSGFERLHDLLSFFSPACFRQNVSAQGDGFAVSAAELRGGFQRFDGPFCFAQLFQHLAELHIADPEFGIEFDRPACVLLGRRMVPGCKSDLRGERLVRHVQRIELARTLRRL